MSKDRLVKAWINPLAFTEVEFSSPGSSESITAETIVGFLCPPGVPFDAQSLVERYKRISAGPQLFLVPAERRLLDKLVWPLRHAKASYVIGNYLSVVPLCGMVAEMVALLLWRSEAALRTGRALTAAEEKSRFRRNFERLSQARRVQILERHAIIGSDVVADFDMIRQTRNNYLHRWSHDHSSVSRDAVKCFQAAISLVIGAVGQEFDDGRAVLRPALVKYLEREGLFESD